MTDPNKKNNNNEIRNLLTNFANSPTQQVWLADLRPNFDQRKMKHFGEEIKSGKKLDKRLQGECSQGKKKKNPFELLAGVIGCGQAVLCHRPDVHTSNSDAVKKPLRSCHVKR